MEKTDRLGRILLGLIAAVGLLAASIWLSRNTAALSDQRRNTSLALPTEVYTPADSEAWLPSVGTAVRPNAATAGGQAEPILNCRFGYNVNRRPISAYDPGELARLRASWFTRWSVDETVVSANGMEFAQVVRLHQTKTGPNWDDPYVQPYTYTIGSPSGATLADSLAKLSTIANSNPRLLWIVGNEMEREDWPGGSQDEMLPELYAVAYHQIYHAIKAGDPTAQVAIGGIIQATPLRLAYLDRVWNSYYDRYHARMPVDVWNIHVFVLREKRYYDGCTDCWGAGVPAGIQYVNEGILYTTEDNRDFSIARNHVIAFREWMRDKGERNKPLIVSEYGVLMPPEWVGFSFEQVRDDFMYPSFDMFLHERDADLGFPADDSRLVQRLAWFSLDFDAIKPSTGDHVFNGWLFHSGLEMEPAGIAPLGVYWESYVTDPAKAPLEVDLLSGQAWTDPVAGFSTGSPVTMTLFFQIANSGSMDVNSTFSVDVYQDGGGPLLGTAVVDGLSGCGSTTVISVTWPNLTPGVYQARAYIDPGNTAVVESKESNNEKVLNILVGANRNYLPQLIKSH